jgi:hypothetical protein
MHLRLFCIALLVPVLALSACGSSKKVDTAGYTCSDFNKSLATKGDNSAGSYINALRKEANLGQSASVERRAMTVGIFYTCRGKPGSTKPAKGAITIAKLVVAGKYKAPTPPKTSKK